MRKDSTVFIITGDTARNKVQVMPGGAHSIAAVEIPAKWDSIMASKGYPSLESMYLPESGDTPTAVPVVSANGSSSSANGSPVSFNGREIVNSEHKKIAIYDASGKMVGRSNTHFSMRSLPSGVYMVYVAGYKGVACKVVKN